jgi:hypothetical protein
MSVVDYDHKAGWQKPREKGWDESKDSLTDGELLGWSSASVGKLYLRSHTYAASATIRH